MSHKNIPECPFCGQYISRPEAELTMFGEILSGRCKCGAVYICDPTGHNVGEAYMEALALAKGDWDINSMGEDIDYQTEDMDYDLKNHQRVYSGGLTVSGKLIFVRMGHAGVLPQEGVDAVDKPDKADDRRISLKGRLKNLLETRSFDKIRDLAIKDKGVIRWLISLSYDKEDVVSWRAIEAIGLAACEISKVKMEVVRDTIRRLLWSMGEESGGIGWSAAETLGEIIRCNPDAFSDIVPILWSFRDEEMFRPGVVWAIGRIAELRPDLVSFILKDIGVMFNDDNPTVRGYAAYVAGILKEKSLIETIKKLLNDESVINVYQGSELLKKKNSEIAEEAIKIING